jgi:hypothetical protein
MTRLRRVALIVLGVGFCSCIPVDPTGNWGLPFGSATAVNDTGSSPGVFVVGDSLLQLQVQTVADAIRFWRGTDSVVVAAAGASTAHFNSPTLIHGVGLSTIAEYEAFFGNVRVTVLALGSNDARILAAEAGNQYGYNFQEYGQQLSKAITDARSHSQCVVLVGIAPWDDAAPRQIVSDINALMAWSGSVDWRVVFADWRSYSAGHPEWFAGPGDVHHSPAGATAYRDFINNWIASMLSRGC